eukprot:TRINITY_DN63622_c0_g1_i1.p1 TRINITY_DN63622_c0_g1~~TRINITY_DN63622_c0_g1_i1.p1  ORF type:complete len:262 (+),score=41.88 TRINITY_DN63622_c0_g1_i1:556-1341(+)
MGSPQHETLTDVGMGARDNERSTEQGSAGGSSGNDSSNSSSSSEEREQQMQLDKLIHDGSADVLQKDARYFTVTNVVCSFCGLKGHMSYDCEEKEEQVRCYLCGGKGHSSRECPGETCHLCKQIGHRARDCTMKGMMKRRVRRKCGPPRELVMKCYVCGKEGHLDCSVEAMASGTLSCLNCGASGHNGTNCNMPSADKMISVVLEMERGRKAQKLAERKRKNSGKGGEEEAHTREQEEREECERFRETLMELAMQRRFKRW